MLLADRGETEVIVAVVNLVGLLLGGRWILCFTAAVFLVIPLFDYIVKWKAIPRQHHDYLEACAALFVYSLWTVLYKVSSPSCSRLEFVLYVIGLSAFTGSYGNAMIHELIHHHPNSIRYKIGRLLGSVLLFDGYHRRHLKDHHVIPATNRDLESAPKGMSFWQYTNRGFWQHYHVQEFHIVRNDPKLLLGYSVGVVHLGIIGLLFGSSPVYVILLNRVVSVFLLALAAYPQHYGMEMAIHGLAWSDYSWLTNRSLFDNGMHFNHHNERFALSQKFRDIQYPLPWPWMAVAGAIPKCFFNLIHPSLDAFCKQQ